MNEERALCAESWSGWASGGRDEILEETRREQALGGERSKTRVEG